MSRQEWEDRLIEYIDGSASDEVRHEVESVLANDPEVKKLYDQLRTVIKTIDQAKPLVPSAKLKANFEKFLQSEINGKPAGKTVFFTPVLYRAAATIALVMVSVAVGYWINDNRQQARELAEMKQQMQEMKSLMLAQMDNQQSATQRLVGVSVAYKMESTDDDIVNALVKTMNEDLNTNVRVAALEALRKFQHFPHVRQALLASLATQNDPAVQIELIRLMVEMKEKEALQQLEKIPTDDKALPAVKDEAHSGILKLS